MLCAFRKIIYCFLALLVLLLSSCTLDGKMWGKAPSIAPTESRETPDFIPGERVVTTAGTPGFEINAVFGETETKTSSLDGRWEVEGVFYE